MANLSGEERVHYVQEMFTRIAPRYDLMNRLMTAGQDVVWRREVVRRAALDPGARVLDLGSGTGDLAQEVRKRIPGGQAVAADFTLEMMRIGQGRPGASGLAWAAADALALPFDNGAFDAAISGFLMRNVTDIGRALREQHRVLKPGGRIVILDTTRPPENLLFPAIRFHLQVIIPSLGQLVTGNAEAYTYLPETTKGFLRAEELAGELVAAGFAGVGFQRRMFGTVAIHWGRKGSQRPFPHLANWSQRRFRLRQS